MSHYELKHIFDFISNINVDVLKLHTTKHSHKIKCKYIAANFSKKELVYYKDVLVNIPNGYEFTIEFNFNSYHIGFMRGDDHSQFIGEGIVRTDIDFYKKMRTLFLVFLNYGLDDIED